MVGNGRDQYFDLSEQEQMVGTRPVEYAPQSPAPVNATSQYAPVQQPTRTPFLSRGRGSKSNNQTATNGTAANQSLLVPRGAVEMLPNESVIFQLGALYLTNKRVILLAPSVLRTAFLRDVDAIGTLTERASGWTFFFALLLLALSGSTIYFLIARTQFQESLPSLYNIDPRFIPFVAIGLALLAIYMLANYFFWVKRTLFLSVGGRPLITVSLADWNARKLEGMDSFVNAFSQVKDAAHMGEVIE